MNAKNDSVELAQHEQYMRRCVELAEIARAHGNTPVGSIVVIDGRIAGEGTEDLPSGHSITGHAEILACQAAIDNRSNKDLSGACLYSTAEPCFMCSYVIRQCQIALVAFGVKTPRIGGITSDHPVLTADIDGWKPAPQVIAGVLADECATLKSGSRRQ